MREEGEEKGRGMEGRMEGGTVRGRERERGPGTGMAGTEEGEGEEEEEERMDGVLLLPFKMEG